MDQFQHDLLRDLQKGFDTGGYATKQTEETAQAPASLRVVVGNLGKIEQDVLFELFFAAIPDQDDTNPYSILNIVATLFTQVPEENYGQLETACMLCNRRVVLGALGTIRESNILHCRDAMVIRHGYPPEVYLQLPVDSLMAMASSIEAVIDGLATVARGMKTAAEADSEGLLG